MPPTKELLANIDYVSYPRDQTVLLTHSDNALSVGVVKTPFDATLVLFFKKPVQKLAIPLTPQMLHGAISTLVTKGENQEEGALILASSIIESWMKCRANEEGLESSPFEANDVNLVRIDAPISESHIQDAQGTPLGRDRSMQQEQKLGIICDQGFAIPLFPIVNSIQDQLQSSG